MLRSIEGNRSDVTPHNESVDAVIEQLAMVLELVDEGMALRHAGVEVAIANISDNNVKKEVRAVSRVTDRNLNEVRARLELIINSVSRLA